MSHNAWAALAAAMAALLIGSPIHAAPFASYPPAPPPDGTALGLVWQGGPTVATADNAWMRANLGAVRVRTLESFAVGLGVSLGSANDQPVFDAANAAIIAARHSGGLAVALPVGVMETASHLLLDNNGGYFCPAPGQCGVRDVYAGPYASASWLVEINDPFATNVLLSGINFYGGWSYGAGAYAAAPESDPALDRRGGVNLVQAYNGPTDTTYYANSALALQEPRGTIENLGVAGFPGDCFNSQGAGAYHVANLRIENCGGRGLTLNTYDSKFVSIDVGATGRSNIVCGAVGCASDQFEGIKGWYAGYRRIAGQDHCLELYGNTNQFDLYCQDQSGTAVVIDNAFANHLRLVANWQGQIPWMDSPICALSLQGAWNNQISLMASIPPAGYALQAYPNVTALVCDAKSATNVYNLQFSTFNAIDALEIGWPNETYGFNPLWVSGPLDTTNHLSVNGTQRTPRQWLADPSTGNIAFGLSMGASAAGLVVDGPSGFYPGQTSLITQSGGGGSLQGFTNTAAAASGTLTSSGNYADGATVTVGARTWTFRASLTTTGTGTSTPNEVQLGATEAASLANLRHAINALRPSFVSGYISGASLTVPAVESGVLHVGDTLTSASAAASLAAGTTITGVISYVPGETSSYSISPAQSAGSALAPIDIEASSGVIGTDYSFGTVPSPDVTAADDGAHALTVTAIAPGVTANSVATTTTAANAAWSSATLTGGAAGTQTYVTGLGWDAAGAVYLPSVIAAGPFTNNAAACAAHLKNGQLWRDTTDTGGALHIASC